MKKLLFTLLAVILITGLLASGCAEPEPAAEPGPAPAPAPAPEPAPGPEKTEILVGAIVSMTGMNAMTGADHRWAYEQAVADINAAGGVYVEEYGKKLPLKLVLADDKSAAADAAAAMEKLIKLEKIDLAMGTNITPLNIAAATVAEKYKVFMACCVTWLDQFGEQNFQWASDMFTSAPGAAEVPYQILDIQSEAERPKAISLMMEDNPDGQGFGSGFKHFAEVYNYNIALDEPYTPGTKDFSSSILKMEANNCDALFWLGSPTDSIVMIRQMKEQQLNLKYIHGWKGFWPNEFVDGLGADSDYIMHDGFWAETLPYPGAKDVGQKYRDTHDGQDSVSIGIPYANVQVLAQAIEKAGSLDSAKVRDEVFGGEFKGTVMGDVTYDDAGLAFTSMLGLQWMDGQRMPVWPQGDYKLKWVPSWDAR